MSMCQKSSLASALHVLFFIEVFGFDEIIHTPYLVCLARLPVNAGLSSLNVPLEIGGLLGPPTVKLVYRVSLTRGELGGWLYPKETDFELFSNSISQSNRSIQRPLLVQFNETT